MASAVLEVFRSRTIDLYRDPDLLRDLTKLSIIERVTGSGHRLVGPPRP